MRDKTTRPENIPLNLRNFHDLERRDIRIPDDYIISRMIDPTALAAHDGSETGRYGVHKYGRCRYGAEGPPGIYGYDTYGNCIYE